MPTLAILGDPAMVDGYAFPARCCIKPTHASGEVVFRRDGEAVDRQVVKGWFAKDYYAETREANYRGLRPKVIVEPIVFPGSELINYRFVCIDGQPRLVIADGEREGCEINRFFRPDWSEIPLDEVAEEGGPGLDRPGNLDEMIAVSQALSAGFGLLRVDFYSDGEKLYVGEVTNCHCGAMRRFRHRIDEERVSAALGPEVVEAIPINRTIDPDLSHCNAV